MAEALQVSLDYLVGFSDHELDQALTQKILDIQTLNDEDKISIMKTIDALLRDAKARKAYAHWVSKEVILTDVSHKLKAPYGALLLGSQ